jgi:hypothetical protein
MIDKKCKLVTLFDENIIHFIYITLQNIFSLPEKTFSWKLI